MTSAADEPKFRLTVVPACSFWNDVLRSPKVPVSEAAADTVMEPDNDGVVVPVEEVVLEDDEHPAARIAPTITAAATSP